MSKELEELFTELKEYVDDKESDFELTDLFKYFSDICAEAEEPMVLIIDEVDSVANNQVFLDFFA